MIDQRYLASYDLNVEAEKLAGNWKKFQSFGWYDRPEDVDQMAIVYTHNRDSDNLALSNAAEIAKELEPYKENGDVIPEYHGHWAVGWMEGFAIRVFRDGQMTEAFLKWMELQARLAEYPILNEEDYSKRNYEFAVENIQFSVGRLVREGVPENWANQVWAWLGEHNPSVVEDDSLCPDQEDLIPALEALGFLEEE